MPIKHKLLERNDFLIREDYEAALNKLSEEGWHFLGADSFGVVARHWDEDPDLGSDGESVADESSDNTYAISGICAQPLRFGVLAEFTGEEVLNFLIQRKIRLTSHLTLLERINAAPSNLRRRLWALDQLISKLDKTATYVLTEEQLLEFSPYAE